MMNVKTVSLDLQPCVGSRSGVGMFTYEVAARLNNKKDLAFRGNLFNFLRRHNVSGDLAGIGMPMRECTALPGRVYYHSQKFFPLSYDTLFGSADLHVFFNFLVPERIKGRIMTTVYDMTPARFPETMKTANLLRLRAGLERSAGVSDHILTISEFSRGEIADCLRVREERISVIYCAPSGAAETADFGITAEKLGIEERPFILFVGTIEPRKNLERLIRAYAMLRREQKIPHRLVLAGGKGWQNDSIYKAAESSGFAEDILFTGYVSDGEKNALYEHADVFVFPSLYEGFGMPPLEAMSRGCPVVASDAASIPEVTGSAALLVSPLDENELAQGILRILTEPELRRELQEKGRKRAQDFSWEDSAERFTEICRELL